MWDVLIFVLLLYLPDDGGSLSHVSVKSTKMCFGTLSPVERSFLLSNKPLCFIKCEKFLK